MRTAIEKVFFINFLMDAFLLYCVVRPLHLVRITRLLFAAFMGASLASLMVVTEISWALRLLSALAAVPVMLTVCCGIFSAAFLIRTCVLFLAAGSAAAAFLALMPGKTPFFVSLAFSAVCVSAFCAVRAKSRATWETPVKVSFAGRKCSFIALIDTGNRLKEPLSGLDVMIVSSPCISRILPRSFDPAQPWRTLPEKFRLVSFGGVGGNGEMACFMPDDLVLNLSGREKRLLRQIWIAVYPGALPGSVQALAPPSVLQ